MHGLDTNVLVRYLTQDDPVQSRKATEIVERRLTAERPGFISLVTMVETVWVLESVYGLSDKQVASTVERMLQTDTLIIQNEQQVFTAMVTLRRGWGAFADALIGALGAWAGCDSTLTFDKKAGRLAGFEIV
ncbi:MAG: type II toxin-antitoxin system VapC family toxin [Terracidiphilus sp.]|jgi:predicted nucleic-acid-binding protein